MSKTLSAEQIANVFATHDQKKAERASNMPTADDALGVLFRAYQRLQELGWRDIIYCPKDGTEFAAIEDSTGGQS